MKVHELISKLQSLKDQDKEVYFDEEYNSNGGLTDITDITETSDEVILGNNNYG